MTLRLIDRLLEKMRSKWIAHEDDQLVMSALATPGLLADLNDPRRFVSFVRGCCIARLTCDVVPIKQGPAPRGLEDAWRSFDVLLHALRDIPPVPAPTATTIARVVDGLCGDRQALDATHWTTDVGLDFQIGSSQPDKGRLLAAVIRFMRPTLGVEIGTFYGISALFIATARPELRQLHTIELNEPQHTLAGEMLRAQCPGRVVSHRGAAHEVLPVLGLKDGETNFLFHDGEHSREAYIRDIGLALPLLGPGAVIVVDDIRWDDPRAGGHPDTYGGWRTVVDHPRVGRAVEISGGIGLMLLGD